MFGRLFYERIQTKPRRFCNAIGPFPRSVWIHPDTPEDSLDRVCFRVWKRSVMTRKGFWPHLPENARLFADDDPEHLYGIQCDTIRKHNDSVQRQCLDHHELDKIELRIQHNVVQTLPKEQDAKFTCPCVPDDRHCPGHEPDQPKEIISKEEVDRRNIEKFLKQILLPKQATKKTEIPEGLSKEDFPPLPPAASPWVSGTPQQSSFSKIGSYKASLLKIQTSNDLPGGTPQSTKKQKQKRPHALNKTTPKISTQSAQVSNIQPSSIQAGSVLHKGSVYWENIMLEQQLSLARCSTLPVFVQSHTQGGDIEMGRSADGAHMAQNRAGSGTGSVRNAAGPLDNAKCHIYHEDAIFLKRKATDMPVPEHSAGIQTPPCHRAKAEWQDSSSCPQQSTPFPQGTGHDLGIPVPRNPWTPAGQYFLFDPPVPEMDSSHMAADSLFPHNTISMHNELGAPLPPSGFGLNPRRMAGDISPWPSQYSHCVNFPDNVNPSAAGRQRFARTPSVPPGFTVAHAFRLFTPPV